MIDVADSGSRAGGKGAGVRSADAADRRSVESLPLSNRTRSRLREARIDRIDDLRTRTDEELLALHGFGHTCLQEVRAVLRVLDAAGAAGASGTAAAADPSFPTAIPDALRRARLNDLPIPNRARAVFARENLKTVEDYLSVGAERLLALRNFGSTTLAAVNRVIRTAAATLCADSASVPFRSAEQLTGGPELDADLERLPIAALDLPRRARRVCQELGLRTLRDLASITKSDLLLHKNFGLATLRRIQLEIDRFVGRLGAARPATFNGVLDAMLARLQQREQQLVELREGRAGSPLTLTEAGARMGLTESRACQIEHSAWSKLRRFSIGITDGAAEAAVALLMRRGGVAPAEALCESPYFSDGGLPAAYVARLLGKLLPHRIARLADGRLAAIPAATLFTLAARLRKRLHRGGESQPLEQLSTDVLRGIDVGEHGPTILRALCEVLFHREVASVSGGGSVVRTATQGLGDDLRQVLLEAGRPLHFGEIARRMAEPPFDRPELSEEKVRLRLCRDARFVLIQRGLYDLAERFQVPEPVRGRLADRAHEILAESGRPTSVALLAGRLQSEGMSGALSEFVLAGILRADARFRHLGRGTFAIGGGDGQIAHISAMLESILDEAGGPLTYAELRQRVQARRQVSDGAISATLVGRDTFLRVSRGVFDLASRHPFDASRRAQLAELARRRLAGGGSVLALDVLADAAAGELHLERRALSGVLVGDLLRRQGGFEFLSGGFVMASDSALERSIGDRAAETLRAAGEPLRPTTIARRLELSPGQSQLLRKVLRDDRRFAAQDDGRFTVAS